MFPIKQQQQQKITKQTVKKPPVYNKTSLPWQKYFIDLQKSSLQTTDRELQMTVKFMREGANFSLKYWSTK